MIKIFVWNFGTICMVNENKYFLNILLILSNTNFRLNIIRSENKTKIYLLGDTIGNLNVYKVLNQNQDSMLQWTLSGNKGNVWYRGTLNLDSSLPYYIIIEGVAGSSYTG
jgi:hypothetical protein